MTTVVPTTASDATPCPRDSAGQEEAESTSEAASGPLDASSDAHDADASKAVPEAPLTVSDPALCPLDAAAPDGAPSALADAEDVIFAVRYRKYLVKDEQGAIRLAALSWSKDDLRGMLDKQTQTKRNASVLRSSTPPAEINKRLALLCKEEDWKSDPIEAVASAGAVRSAKDANDRQLFCLFSDPASDPEPLGDCPTHAGIVKTAPHPDRIREQIDWLMIRTKLSDQFKTVQHRSGKVPILDEQVAV